MTPAEPASRRSEALQAAGLLLLVAAALLSLGVLDPYRLTGGLPCPFRALTGCFCPGCGSTRAVRHLLHGDLLAALRHNVLTTLAAPFLLFALGRYAWAAFAGRQVAPIRLPARVIWAMFWVVIVFWAVRNIPAWPWTLLAPPR